MVGRWGSQCLQLVEFVLQEGEGVHGRWYEEPLSSCIQTFIISKRVYRRPLKSKDGLSIWQIFSLSGSKATCQFESFRGWECVCPKGYEGDGRICYGNAADVSMMVIFSECRSYCTVLTPDLNQKDSKVTINSWEDIMPPVLCAVFPLETLTWYRNDLFCLKT